MRKLNGPCKKCEIQNRSKEKGEPTTRHFECCVVGLHRHREKHKPRSWSQDEWPLSLDLPFKPSARKWCLKVIEELLEICWNMWEHCNHTLHLEELPMHDCTNEPLKGEIKQHFHQFHKERFLCNNLHLLRQHVKKLKEQTLEEKHMWLASIWAVETRKALHDCRCQQKAAQWDTKIFITKPMSHKVEGHKSNRLDGKCKQSHTFKNRQSNLTCPNSVQRTLPWPVHKCGHPKVNHK